MHKTLAPLLTAFIVAPLSAAILNVPDAITAASGKDVTAEFNAFLKDLPDDTTLNFPDDAEYRIEGTLLLEGKKGIVLEGNGTTFRATDPLPDYGKKDNYSGWKMVRTRSQWLIKNCENITVRNMRVIGAYRDGGRKGEYDYNREAQHAFDILGVKGLLIDSIHASDVWGDGVYISKGSSDVIVRKSRIERTGRQGMAVGSAFGVLIEDNDILDSRRGLLDIEPYGKDWACGDVRVIGNRFGDSRLLALPMGGSGSTGTVLVANNVFSGPNGTPLVMHRTKSEGVKRGPFFFVGNEARVGGSPAPGLRFGEVHGVLIAGNSLTFNPKRSMSVLTIPLGPTGVFGNAFPGAARLTTGESEPFLIDAGNTFEKGPANPAQILEIEGGYAVKVDLGEGKQVLGVMRASGTEGQALEAFGIETEKQWAWELQEDGKTIEHAEG